MDNNTNRYYRWWKENKLFLALFPAVVFLLVSMIFFIIGLKFENPVVIFGIDVARYIAIALSLANTVIQIIGNEQDPDDIGMSLWIMWIGSYILGIGTNVTAILSLLSINNVFLEWMIAFGLGTIIEVSPEKLFVMFLKGFKGFSRLRRSSYTPNQQGSKGQNKPGFRPQNESHFVSQDEEEERRPHKPQYRTQGGIRNGSKNNGTPPFFMR